MKKLIVPVITQAVILGGVISVSLATPVAAEELAVKTSNGVSYVSGGFGLDERQRLRSIARGDNLELSFALTNKEYLGGANVVIKGQNGSTVLEDVSDGPLFYAQLPAGTYTVEARAMGKTLRQNVQVPSKGQARVHFAWNSADATMAEAMAHN